MDTIKIDATSEGVSSNRLGAQMEQIIVSRLEGDRLSLPALPLTATRCLGIIRDPDFDTKKLVASIEQDPALAAQVLKLAGSAAYNYDGGRVTLVEAVVRLGADKMTTLILDAATRQLYESRDKRIAGTARSIYTHSVGVALLARDLTIGLKRPEEADTAYLCGLLHDVGKVVVAAMLLEAERMICAGDVRRRWTDSEAWLTAIDHSHRKVGIALCEKWLFPPPVQRAIANLDAYDTAEPNSPANVVRLANAAAKKAGLPGGTFIPAEIDELTVRGRILLGLSEDFLATTTAGLRERVRAQFA
jgi:putative nucleotidyltransferase with HDIG domain